MPTRQILVGLTFGKLKVLSEAESVQWKNRNIRQSICQCDCGKTILVRDMHLRTGHTTSCGCQRGESNTRHGRGKRGMNDRTYVAWCNMIARCENQKHKQYKDYGGRGITVCKKWRDSFIAFLKDIGDVPECLTIDRIDTNKGYYPGNVRFATSFQQNQTRRRDINLTVRGITGSLSLLCRHFNAPYNVALRRIHANWTPEDAIFTPSRKRR